MNNFSLDDLDTLDDILATQNGVDRLRIKVLENMFELSIDNFDDLVYIKNKLKDLKPDTKAKPFESGDFYLLNNVLRDNLEQCSNPFLYSAMLEVRLKVLYHFKELCDNMGCTLSNTDDDIKNIEKEIKERGSTHGL